MRRLAVCLVALLLGLPTTGRSQQPETNAVRRSACSPTDCPMADGTIGDKIDHLRQAAEHLTAAGMDAEAKRVRERAELLRHDLLKQKVAELDRLQAEVHELRRATGQIQQVLVHVQVLELSRTKMRNLGFDLQHFETLQFCDRIGITGLLDALRQENIVKVLASPTLVTADRRPASFVCGGEMPTPVVHPDKSTEIRFKRFGTQVDVTPTLLGGGKVRLEIHPRISEVDPTLGVAVGDVQVPGLRVHEMDTRIDMELGQTAVIGGLIQQRIQKAVNSETQQASPIRDEIQTVFLVTPELVDGTPGLGDVGSTPAPPSRRR